MEVTRRSRTKKSQRSRSTSPTNAISTIQIQLKTQEKVENRKAQDERVPGGKEFDGLSHGERHKSGLEREICENGGGRRRRRRRRRWCGGRALHRHHHPLVQLYSDSKFLIWGMAQGLLNDQVPDPPLTQTFEQESKARNFAELKVTDWSVDDEEGAEFPEPNSFWGTLIFSKQKLKLRFLSYGCFPIYQPTVFGPFLFLCIFCVLISWSNVFHGYAFHIRICPLPFPPISAFIFFLILR